jgi:hypothetical protein
MLHCERKPRYALYCWEHFVLRKGYRPMDHIERERARSLKIVQVVFAFLALLCLVASLTVSVKGDELGLPDGSAQTISIGFLIVGAMDTALIFAWERLLSRMQS